jgi:hypothetical protein
VKKDIEDIHVMSLSSGDFRENQSSESDTNNEGVNEIMPAFSAFLI